MSAARGMASRRVTLTTGVVVGCVLVIGASDLLTWVTSVPEGVQALIDEPGHLAVGILALAAIGISFPVPVVLAVLAGSVLIDLDHIPALLGTDVLQHGVPRPYTHSLLTVAVVVAVAALLRDRDHRRLALVVALALVLHLVRDLAEPLGPGVSLLWPLSDHAYTLAYGWWAGLVIALTAIALARRRHRRGPPPAPADARADSRPLRAARTRADREADPAVREACAGLAAPAR